MQENGVAQENSRTLNHQIMMNIKTKPNLGYGHMHIQIVSKFMSKLKCIWNIIGSKVGNVARLSYLSRLEKRCSYIIN